MSKVAVVADSTCCLPQELFKQYDVSVIPILIVHNGKTYRDGIDITPNEVYQIMRRREELPTTSTPSAGDFLECFAHLGQTTENILCITLTSLQSMTYDTAMLAREQAKETMPDTRIEVFDSRATAGALGLIVLEAARAASRGADLDEAIDVARSVMQRANFLAMVDTLYYLARTGRVARAAAWAGALLDMKPVVEHSPLVGETTGVARPRTRAKAIKRLLDLMSERVGDKPVHVVTCHADELEEGEKLRDEIGRRFNCTELHLTEFTPGMGVHAGPGIVGMGFYTD